MSLPLVFGDDAVFQVSAGSLAVEGPIDTAGHLLTVDAAAATTATIDGSISGSGSLSKSGDGKLVLAGGGDLGNVTVQNGTLQVTTANAFADGASLTVGSNSGLFSAVVPEQSPRVAVAAGAPAVASIGAPEGRSIVAQRFNAGTKVNGNPVASPLATAETAKSGIFNRPYGTTNPPNFSHPSSKLLGYHQSSVPDRRTTARAKVFENLAVNLAKQSAAGVDWPWGALDPQDNAPGNQRNAALLARDAILAEYAR